MHYLRDRINYVKSFFRERGMGMIRGRRIASGRGMGREIEREGQ